MAAGSDAVIETPEHFHGASDRSRDRRRGLGKGAFFLSAFGTAWLAGGVFLATAGELAAVLPILVAGGALAWFGQRLMSGSPAAPTDAAGLRRTRWFKWANILQYVGIGTVVLAANLVGRPDIVPLGISVVVALHLLPLAYVFRNPVQYGSAALILAADAWAVARAPHASAALVGFGTGATLWLTAIVQLVRGYALPRTDTLPV